MQFDFQGKGLHSFKLQSLFGVIIGNEYGIASSCNLREKTSVLPVDTMLAAVIPLRRLFRSLRRFLHGCLLRIPSPRPISFRYKTMSVNGPFHSMSVKLNMQIINAIAGIAQWLERRTPD